MTALGGTAGSANPLPPEGIHPAACLPVPAGATRKTVELGDRIFHGVPKPKEYRSPMPPMGGAQLTHAQVAAVAAYVWGLGHTSH